MIYKAILPGMFFLAVREMVSSGVAGIRRERRGWHSWTASRRTRE